MAGDDLVVASTTDTEEAMQAALMHGIEASTEAPILSTVDADEKEEKEPAKEPAKPEAKPKVEAKPAEKKAEAKEPAKELAKPEIKSARPKREDFETEDEWADALMGHRATKRIDKLTFEREEANRRAEKLEARIADLEKKPVEEKKEAAPVVAPKPKAEDFETHEAWLEALVDWKADQKVGPAVKAAVDAERAKAEKADEGIQREEEFQKFIGQRTEARERYDDFDDVIKDNEDMKLNGIMNYVIMSSEVGNDIAYYLATHREEAEEVYALEGPDAIRAMGKLEAKVEHIVASKVGKAKAEEKAEAVSTDGAEIPPAKKPLEEKVETKPKRVASQAAEPIEPVGARATRSTVPDEELDYQGYKAKRDREEANRKKFRR